MSNWGVEIFCDFDVVCTYLQRNCTSRLEVSSMIMKVFRIIDSMVQNYLHIGKRKVIVNRSVTIFPGFDLETTIQLNKWRVNGE